jgi:hypothetical protein
MARGCDVLKCQYPDCDCVQSWLDGKPVLRCQAERRLVFPEQADDAKIQHP